MKSKLEIYALAVCFASVICLVISLGIAGYSLVSMWKPEITINSYAYDRFQTNDAFWEFKNRRRDDRSSSKPPEEMLTRQRLEEYSIELKGEVREGLQTLIKSLIFVLVAGVALVSHSHIARKSRGA